ncbi:MAG: cytochrome c biogenesis protein ResB [Saprospirales bacterium]|nr:cytochrome c biogenesis protein ResB [Saprospirales bacterium]
MAELSSHTSSPRAGVHRAGFINTGSLLAITALTGIVAQNVFKWFAQSSFPGWAAPLIAVVVLGAFAVIFFKPIYKTLDTPYFAILSLLIVAAGTALGTFITQNALPEVFAQRYGPFGSKVFRFLNINDVFHSWWYVGFFVLLIISFVKLSLKKGFAKGTFGFHLAHLSPILILAGFWIDYYYGFRGIIQLETGQRTNIVKVYEGSTSYIRDSIDLDFQLQLDAFEFEKHDPDYRLQVWRNNMDREPREKQNEAPSQNMVPELIASFPLTMDKIRDIYGTDLHFRMSDFYPNFQFVYSYPEGKDTIAPADPGIFLEMKTPLGETVVQLRSNVEGKNKIVDMTHLGASIEFYWELPEDVRLDLLRKTAASQEPDTNRIIIVGASEQVFFLTDGELREEKLESDRVYPLPHREDSGFSMMLLFPDATYLVAAPGSKGEELLNPVAKVDVWATGWDAYQEAYIYPNKGKRGGVYSIPGSNYLLAMESFKDKETKYWKSTVSIVDENDQVAKTQAIMVNKPMLARGYRFYQTDYDPENPNYSGIGVSHEPGLYVIYLGFFVLVVGSFLLFYTRKHHQTV